MTELANKHRIHLVCNCGLRLLKTYSPSRWLLQESLQDSRFISVLFNFGLWAPTTFKIPKCTPAAFVKTVLEHLLCKGDKAFRVPSEVRFDLLTRACFLECHLQLLVDGKCALEVWSCLYKPQSGHGRFRYLQEDLDPSDCTWRDLLSNKSTGQSYTQGPCVVHGPSTKRVVYRSTTGKFDYGNVCLGKDGGWVSFILWRLWSFNSRLRFNTSDTMYVPY